MLANLAWNISPRTCKITDPFMPSCHAPIKPQAWPSWLISWKKNYKKIMVKIKLEIRRVLVHCVHWKRWDSSKSDHQNPAKSGVLLHQDVLHPWNQKNTMRTMGAIAMFNSGRVIPLSFMGFMGQWLCKSLEDWWPIKYWQFFLQVLTMAHDISETHGSSFWRGWVTAGHTKKAMIRGIPG